MTEKSKTAVAYICTSLPQEHPDRAAQVEQQRKAIIACAVLRDAEIVAEFIDYGIASDSFSWFPQYHQMIDYLKETIIDFVIIENLSRMVREGIDLPEMLSQVNQAGTVLVTASPDEGIRDFEQPF